MIMMNIYIYIHIYIYIRINLDSFDNILKVKPFFQKLQIVNLTNTKYDAAQKKSYFDSAAPPIKSWAGSIPASKPFQ